jgi:hypothetical protein
MRMRILRSTSSVVKETGFAYTLDYSIKDAQGRCCISSSVKVEFHIATEDYVECLAYLDMLLCRLARSSSSIDIACTIASATCNNATH